MTSQYHTSQAHLTSAERVILDLRNAITFGKLPAGSQIVQEEIAAQYKVSRMPVREAFRQLEAEGLLVVYPGRGAFVKQPSPEEILEICDIRILLECDAIKRAVPLLTPIILQEADLLLAKMAAEEDDRRFGQLDQEFHALLYGQTKRFRQLELINTLRNQVMQFLFTISPIEGYRDGAVKEHQLILDACKANDVHAAVDATKLHLEKTADLCRTRA